MNRRRTARQGLYAEWRALVLREPSFLVVHGAAGLLTAAAQAGIALSAGLMAREVASGRGAPISLGLLGVVAASAKVGASAVLARLEARMCGAVGAALRDEVAVGLLSGARDRGGPADLHRITTALRRLERSAMTGLLGGARAILVLLPLTAVLVVGSPKLSAVAAVVVVPFAIALSWFRHSLHTQEGVALTRSAEVDAEVDELIRHVDLWRTFGAGARVRDALRQGNERASRALGTARAWAAALSAGNELIAAFALLVLTVALSRDLVPIAGADLVLFLSVFFLAYRPLRDLGDARTALRSAGAALETLAPFRVERTLESALHTSTPPVGILQATDLGSLHGGRVSFTVGPGEIVAIVGPTGVGKTTLLRVLLGLEPAEGRLSFGGVDLTSAGVGPASRPFAWAPQDVPIVGGTLAQNLALASEGGQGAGRDELRALAGDSLVDDIEDQLLGASGRPLSGGERAFVALARAFATGLPVLLLDEPTASMDPEAEARFLDLVGRLRPGKAIVIVTHRASTAAIADRIVHLGQARRGA